MTSPVILESFYTAAFLVSESNGAISRDVGAIDNAGTVAISQPGGLVLSKDITGTGTITAGTNTGNGTLGTLTQGNLVMAGTYAAVATAATVFSVSDPNGAAMAVAHTGTAYADAELGFIINAGTTAFVANDSFSIVIPPGDGNFIPYTGTKPAAGILFNRTENIPASSNKACTVLVRNAEVNLSELQWDPTVVASGSVVTLEATAVAQLRLLGIIAR
jgi:hypothetical protein